MRHFKTALLSTLSVLAVFTATQAAADITSLGSLKTRGGWQVGTVNAQAGGEPYCAMMGTFSKNAVLAFSRLPDGTNSMAVDFGGEFFDADAQYEITLRIDGAKPRNFPGRASSAGSIVVPFGRDDKFYNVLSSGEKLKIEAADVEAVFSLQKFAGSYASLLDCARGLQQPTGPKTAAVPVIGVEKKPLPPVADNSAELTRQKTLLAEAAEQKKKDTARLEEVKQQQMKLEQEKLEQSKKLAEADQQGQALIQRVAELQKDKETLQTQMDKALKAAAEGDLAVAVSKSLKEDLAVKQKQLDEAIKQQVQKSSDLAHAITGTKTDFEAKLAVTEAERDDLRSKLHITTADNASLAVSKKETEDALAALKVKFYDLETRMMATGQNRQEVSLRVEAQEKQIAALQAALGAKESELAAVKDADKKSLTALQEQIATLKAEYATVLTRLQAQVRDTTAQYGEVKRKLNEQIIAAPVAVAPAPVPVPSAAPVVAAATEAPLPAAKPDASAKKQVDMVKQALAYRKAAPEKEIAALKEPSDPVGTFLNKIKKENAAVKVPLTRMNPRALQDGNGLSEAVTLESLLNSSGLVISDFVPLEQAENSVVSRWVSDKVNGMYEQTAAAEDFNGQIDVYLDRYRQDCGETADIHVSRAETGRAGTLALADMACTAPSNTYASTFLFWRDGNGFSVILHTSYLSDRSAVRAVRDTLAKTLRESQGFMISRAMGTRSARDADAPLRLNIPDAGTPAPSAEAYQPETILIQ